MAVGDYDELSATGGVSTFTYPQNLMYPPYHAGAYNTPSTAKHMVETDSKEHQEFGHWNVGVEDKRRRGVDVVDGSSLFNRESFFDTQARDNTSYNASRLATMSGRDTSNYTASTLTARLEPTTDRHTLHYDSYRTDSANLDTRQDRANSVASDSANGMSRSIGHDSFIGTPVAQSVIEMGFPPELVRTVIHLKVVETGSDYLNPSDLLDAVLAYKTALTDVDDWSDIPSPTPPPQLQTDQAIHHSPRNHFSLPPPVDDIPLPRADQDHSTPRHQNDANDASPSFEVPEPLPEPNVVAKQVKRKGARSRTLGVGKTEEAKQKTPREPVPAPWLVKEENTRLKQAKLCKVCQDREVKVVFLPCGHLVCCDMCSPLLTKCTLCNKDIKGSVKVFMA